MTLASLRWGGGVKTHEKRTVVSMFNWYKQLHNLDVFGAQDATIISLQEKYRALRGVNLIKEKRCGKIKERTCADGIRQLTYISQEEATLPTITPGALFVLLLIDAHGGRVLHTFDVMGAYLHTSLPDDKVVHMKLEGEFV